MKIQPKFISAVNDFYKNFRRFIEHYDEHLYSSRIGLINDPINQQLRLLHAKKTDLEIAIRESFPSLIRSFVPHDIKKNQTAIKPFSPYLLTAPLLTLEDIEFDIKNKISWEKYTSQFLSKGDQQRIKIGLNALKQISEWVKGLMGQIITYLRNDEDREPFFRRGIEDFAEKVLLLESSQ